MKFSVTTDEGIIQVWQNVRYGDRSVCINILMWNQHEVDGFIVLVLVGNRSYINFLHNIICKLLLAENVVSLHDESVSIECDNIWHREREEFV